jgi:hypothetical protein
MYSTHDYEPGDPEFRLNEHLAISHDSDWIREYLDEVLAIKTLDDISRLIAKWSGLIHECSALSKVTEDELPALLLFIATPELDVNQEWLNARVPPSTLRLFNAARHFGVNPGVVFLQLLDHGCYAVEETPAGRVVRLLPRDQRPQPAAPTDREAA